MTSYTGVNIASSIIELNNALGEAVGKYLEETGEKVQVEWEVDVPNFGNAYIYSWKEYRVLSESERISFHIGATSKAHAIATLEHVKSIIYKKQAS